LDDIAAPEFAEALAALERMCTSMIVEPTKLSNSLWKEIARGDVTALLHGHGGDARAAPYQVC
jgi:hypothetical protein